MLTMTEPYYSTKNVAQDTTGEVDIESFSEGKEKTCQRQLNHTNSRVITLAFVVCSSKLLFVTLHLFVQV